MCYDEMRGMGGDVFAAVWRCGVSWLRVVALGFRWQCADVTHPLPLSRGEVRVLIFLLKMSDLWRRYSPLERGLRGVLW